MKVEIETGDIVGIRAAVSLWLRLVPMMLMAGVATLAATALAVPIAASVLLRGRIPQRLARFQAWVIRQRVRTFTGLFLLRPDPPPWPREQSLTDPGDDPKVTVTLEPPMEMPRWTPLTHAGRAVAHLTVLVPIAIVLDLLLPLWLVNVARHGWSATARARLVTIEQWTAEVLAHAWLVSDQAPRWRWSDLWV